jgi:hypothetical protein
MKIDNFKELLLRKSKDDLALQTLIKFAEDDIIIDKVIESLEKMARARHKGDVVNHAVRDFGVEMDPELEPNMIRDAIGHHVSNYKAALKSGNTDVANQHARQAFRIMNLADRAQKHSHGKLAINYVDPKPWERQKFTQKYEANHPKVLEGKYKPGEYTTKTKGLNYAIKGKDFSFLKGSPHESYNKDVAKHGHNKAYPFENISVNNKHITVDDVEAPRGFTSHHFDNHPIMEHFEESPMTRAEDRDKQYHADKHKFYNESPHINNHFEQHEKMQNADPEGYAKRGSKVSTPVHDDIPGLDLDKAKPGIQNTPPPTIQPKPVASPKNKVSFKGIQWDELSNKPDLITHLLSHQDADLSTVPPEILDKYGPKKGGK